MTINRSSNKSIHRALYVRNAKHIRCFQERPDVDTSLGLYLISGYNFDDFFDQEQKLGVIYTRNCRATNENNSSPGGYLLLGSLFEVMEGQTGLWLVVELGTGLSCGSYRGVVVVVVAQADVGVVSRGFLEMQRRRRPQLLPSFLQHSLPRLVARVQPIAAGNQRYRVVVFDVADVSFIDLSRRSVQHFFELAKT